MYFNSLILTTVTLASMNNALPDDGVTAAPKHVRAVLTSILKLFLGKFTFASDGE
jgi:hypothetical protein